MIVMRLNFIAVSDMEFHEGNRDQKEPVAGGRQQSALDPKEQFWELQQEVSFLMHTGRYDQAEPKAREAYCIAQEHFYRAAALIGTAELAQWWSCQTDILCATT